MKLLGYLLLLFYLNSCSLVPQRTQQIVAQSEEAGFTLHRYHTSTFVLTAYERLPSITQGINPIKQTNKVHVYIEGDGNSWKSKYVLSKDPTPRQPLALTLALQDPYPYIIYIARPCQYTPHVLDPHCTSIYWSSHRYAPEVIQSTSDVLDQIKLQNNLPDLHFVLIGFSGGASVATLISAERQDVDQLITVAGDLDHEALNEYHGTTPLRGSLNPTTIASKLCYLPQDHWSGSRDRIVPPWVAEAFVKRINQPVHAQVHVLQGAGHHKGWKEDWKKILAQSLIE